MAVQIILKSSSVEDKRPQPSQLSFNEISLNYNEAGPFICCKDSSGRIVQLGGVKFSPDVPADALPGTWWLNTATETLFVWDGLIWHQIGGQSGGGGGITQILGDDGIDAFVNGSVVTLNVDANQDKGLHFLADRLAINVGANLSFDSQGRLKADVLSVSYKGTLDLTNDPVVSNPNPNDAYINVVVGTLSADWQAATGEGAIAVKSGDTVIYTPSGWSFIPAPVTPTDLGVNSRTATGLDVTSSTGTDALLPAATDLLAGLMTAVDKAKLDAVEDGAQVNVNADWDATTGDAEILNKPTLFPSNWVRTGTKLTPRIDGDTVAVTAADGTENITLNPDGTANAVEGTFTDDVNLGGDIRNTTTDGDQDIICDGAGLVKLTEYNRTPMEVVTKTDIGTGANEVPLNGFLGTLAYMDDLAIQDGITVANLPTSPTARVGNINRVTDGAASLTWGATVTGGGTAQYLVWYNGTNWTVFGA